MASATNDIYEFPDGSTYVGDFKTNESGVICRHGRGVYTEASGEVYDGQWANDKMEGQGKMTMPNGCVYEGAFANNAYNGKGKYTWSNGTVFQSNWQDNTPEASGTFTDPTGIVWCKPEVTVGDEILLKPRMK